VQTCNEGANTCDDPPLCIDFSHSFGDTISGSNSSCPDNLNSYSCVNWNESGSEVVYAVTLTGLSTISVDQISSDFDADYFLLADSTDSSSCLVYGNTSFTSECLPAGDYYIVVDGYNGGAGNYSFDLNSSSCFGDDDDDDDYTDMVQIPAGNFWMGCEPEDTLCNSYSDESPRHEVTLSAYYIDTYEVTNSRYVGFLNANGNLCDGYECADADDPDLRLSETGGVWSVDSGYEDHPLVEVSWYGANAFCEWTGGRLPTEAEWEKAAKGATEHYIYPWGDTWVANAVNWYNSGDPYDNGTTPVGYYDGSMQGAFQTADGRSPYGVHDMAGNVSEWVNDWYDSWYYSTSPSTDPPGPATGTIRGMRGNCWALDYYYMRASDRNWSNPDLMNKYHGFRCSRD
jgi:formylglycine-generating enzyme required for sulfatase activity